MGSKGLSGTYYRGTIRGWGVDEKGVIPRETKGRAGPAPLAGSRLGPTVRDVAGYEGTCGNDSGRVAQTSIESVDCGRLRR